MAKEKSAVIFDVAIWDEDTDLNKLEEMIRGIKIEGLNWGEAKRVSVVGNIFKLQIVAMVEDKVSVEEITEMIEGWEDLVQSVDIVSFCKM